MREGYADLLSGKSLLGDAGSNNEQAREFLSKVQLDCTFYVGGAPGSDEIATINAYFRCEGLNLVADGGYRLGIHVDAVLLEDMAGVPKGVAYSDTFDDTGAAAIRIGERWYLWSSQIK